MTRTEMRAFLRARIDDTHSTRWADADLNRELLSAARFISQKAAIQNIFPRILTKTQTLTVVSGTTAYELNTDFVLLLNARRTDVTPPMPCTEISEQDYPEWESAKVWSDSLGRPVFYLSSNTTPAMTFNFPCDPQRGMTIILTYQKMIADVSGDSSSFEIPLPLHEMVCLFAGIHMLGTDAAQQMGVATDYAAREEQLIQLMRRTRRPQYVVPADGLC